MYVCVRERKRDKEREREGVGESISCDSAIKGWHGEW